MCFRASKPTEHAVLGHFAAVILIAFSFQSLTAERRLPTKSAKLRLNSAAMLVQKYVLSLIGKISLRPYPDIFCPIKLVNCGCQFC